MKTSLVVDGDVVKLNVTIPATVKTIKNATIIVIHRASFEDILVAAIIRWFVLFKMQNLRSILLMSGRTSSSSSAAVLVTPSPELTDRMYTDLVQALVWSRDAAEKRARDAESRLHELELRLIKFLPTTSASIVDDARGEDHQ